jgi:type III secretion protein T
VEITNLSTLESTFRSLLMVMPRLAPIFFILPIFSGDAVAGLVRNGFIMVLALFIAPVVAAGVATPMAPFMWVGLAAKEALIGVLLGFAFSAFLWAIENAGHLIDFQTGSANAQFFDPVSGHEGGPTSGFLTYLAMALFMAGGGFQAMLALIFESYRLWPVASFFPNVGAGLDQFALKETDSIMSLTMKLAAPVLLVLIVVELGIGLINRVVPQLNVFSFSWPVKSSLATLMMALFLYFVYESLRSFLNPDSGILEFLRALIQR